MVPDGFGTFQCSSYNYTGDWRQGQRQGVLQWRHLYRSMETGPEAWRGTNTVEDRETI